MRSTPPHAGGRRGREKERDLPVRIRLKRMGTNKKPSYRIVVIDSRKPRDGRTIDELGYYDPRAETLKLDADKAKLWISRGAQPSETVATLIRRTTAPAAEPAPAPKKLGKKAAAKAAAEAEQPAPAPPAE